ncbi:MAG: hypothetical protein K1Y36_07245 [Blastocatellia bacterium]|nr:hypothetical protein [Blastocatellia bacterium]
MAVDTSFDRVRVFQCPSCQEYITTDAERCRFCGIPVDRQASQAEETKQVREENLTKYKGHMFGGIAFFLCGLLGVIFSAAIFFYVRSVGIYVITFGMMASGIAEFSYGYRGWKQIK